MKKWTKAEAIAWLVKNDFKHGDYDHMANWHSFRQTDPGQYDRFTNGSPASGIMFIYGWKGSKSEVQSVRFYHGEEDSKAALNPALAAIKDFVRYKDTLGHQGMPASMTLKDIDKKQGIVQAYASAFNVVDSDNEIIRPGAFKNTIEARGPKGANRIAFLKQHRVDYLLGKPNVLKEDEKGLYFESKILPTSYGRDVLILYEGGAINEHSIGYDVIEKLETEGQPRELLEVRLWDVSAVVWGANDQTPFVGMKSVEDFVKAQAQVEAMNRVLAKEITDDTAFQIEYLLRQMEQGMIDFLKGYQVQSPDGSSLRSLLELSHSDVARMLRKQLDDMEQFIHSI